MAWIKAINVACAGLVAGAFISLASPSFGQETGGSGEQGGFQAGETGPGPQQDADMAVAALQAQIAALTTRLEQLEKDKDQLTVKAPFIVTNAQGMEIFRVDAEGSGGKVTVIGSSSRAELAADSTAAVRLSDSASSAMLTTESGSRINLKSGNQSFFAGPADGNMTLMMREGQTTIGLIAKAGGPLIDVGSGAKSVSIGARGAAYGLAVENGETLHAALGDPGDGLASLRIYQDGTGVALQAGLHKNGLPGFSVWDGNNALVRIEKAESGGTGGQVKVFDGGQQVVTLGTADNNTGLHIKKDNDVVFAGKAAEGPQFSLQQGANKLFNVTVQNGDPSLFLGKDKQSWLMSAKESLSLSGSVDSMRVVMGIGSGRKGFVLEKAEKTEAFIGQISDGTNGMAIYGKGESPLLTAAVIGGTPGFRVRTDDGKEAATLAATGSKEGELKLFDATGETVKIGTTKASGAIALSKGGSPTITLGSTEAKEAPAFRAYDGGKVLLAAGAGPNQGIVVAYSGNGQVGAGLESDSNGNGAVYVMSNGAEAASINSTDIQGEGRVVVYGAGKKHIAFLSRGSKGGGNVTTTDPSGTGVFSAGYIGGDGPGGACVLHKGMKCLGVGLTGMEGFR